MVMRLYYLRGSPPVRAVLLAAKNLGVELDLKMVDLLKDENYQPAYLKLNPQHSVPTLDDNGFVIWDSHAINAYLVNKYGKTDELYPRAAQPRAKVDQRLHFDSGTLFPRLVNTAFPIMRKGQKFIPEENKTSILDAYKLLDTIIGDDPWVAGSEMTIADFSCVTTVTTLNVFVPQVKDFSRLSAWVEKCKAEMPHYQWANQKGLDMFQALITSCLSK